MVHTPPETPASKAVAIEYDEGANAPPIITASGRGRVAEEILSIAFANGIKVREDADLVEILELLDIDSPIPLDAFAVVAEILSYVYQANASAAQRKAANKHKEDG